MYKKFFYAFFVSTAFSTSAFALSYAESYAFDTSMEAAGQVLSSPALPSLDNDGVFAVSPLLGVVKIEGRDYTEKASDGTDVTSYNSGTVNGKIAGLTLNYAGKGDLGYFAIAAWSKVTGDMQSALPQFGQTTDVRNISAESYVGAIGLTYRLVGDAKSTFALGVFGGPGIIMSKTSSDIYHSGGITKVTVNPTITGYYLGIQFTVRIGEFHINPYVNMLGNPNPQCAKPEYAGDAYPSGQYNKCDNGDRGISTLAIIAGSGINVGYGRFQFGLATQGGAGSRDLKSTPLVFSLRIGI